MRDLSPMAGSNLTQIMLICIYLPFFFSTELAVCFYFFLPGILIAATLSSYLAKNPKNFSNQPKGQVQLHLFFAILSK